MIDNIPTNKYGTAVAKICHWCPSVIEPHQLGYGMAGDTQRSFRLSIFCSLDCRDEYRDFMYARTKLLYSMKSKEKKELISTITDKSKRWYHLNIHKGRKKASDWRLKNHERFLEIKRAYYARNRKRLILVMRERRKKQKDIRQALKTGRDIISGKR